MRRFRNDESGFTLAEMVVGITVAMVVTSVVLGGVVAVYRAQRYTGQDTDSLGSLRSAVGQLEKELRQARKLFLDSAPRRIRFWVDYDRDRVPDIEERIIWELVTSGSTAQLTRTTQAIGARVVTVARNLVPQDVFAYNADKTLVSVTFAADASPGELSPERQVHTDVRLRNAAAQI